MADSMKHVTPFIMAFPVKNLEATKLFYKEVLGCAIERSGRDSVDFNFYGNIITARLHSSARWMDEMVKVQSNQEPLHYFGVQLDKPSWKQLLEKLEVAGMDFVLEPSIMNKGKSGERGTMFIEDPSGNYLGFTYYNNRK